MRRKAHDVRASCFPPSRLTRAPGQGRDLSTWGVSQDRTELKTRHSQSEIEAYLALYRRSAARPDCTRSPAREAGRSARCSRRTGRGPGCRRPLVHENVIRKDGRALRKMIVPLAVILPPSLVEVDHRFVCGLGHSRSRQEETGHTDEKQRRIEGERSDLQSNAVGSLHGIRTSRTIMSKITTT